MGRTADKEKINECIKYLTYLVDEMDDVFFDEDNKKIIQSLVKKTEEIVHLSIFDGDAPVKAVVLFMYDKLNEKGLIERLSKYMRDNLKDSEKMVQLIGIVEKVGERNSVFQIIKNSKKGLCKEAKKSHTKFSYSVIFIPNVDKQPIFLDVTRLNSLIFPEPNINFSVMPSKDDASEKMSGYVFVVKLDDLVKIYDRVGDKLFESNLRYGIEDKMSLEHSMRNTLFEEPEMFWFYNNGITIVTKNDTIELETGKVILDQSWNTNKITFSVINGAQTISTASRIFADNTVDSDKLENAKRNAKVLLRIITAKDNSTRRNITIALNRQKPIRQEDIAFQTTFVSTFNEYMDNRKLNNKEYLHIIKRGETVYDDNTIELPLFAQLVYACFMNPTEARNNGSAILYYGKDNIEKLNSVYFREEFSETTSSSSRESTFDKYYQEIIWAYKIYKSYNSELKKYVDKDKKMILANNRWSFISYVLKVMNHFSGKLLDIDYSEFREKEGLIDNIRKYMDEFVKTVNRAYNNLYKPNASKLKDFWEKICETEMSGVFGELATEKNTIEGELSKADFVRILMDMSFSYDKELGQYVAEMDTVMFSDIRVIVNENSFDISTMLFNPYYGIEGENDINEEKYASLLQEMLSKFNNLFEKKPDIEEYLGCKDSSVDLIYKGEKFDKGFVNNFIALVSEIGLCADEN